MLPRKGNGFRFQVVCTIRWQTCHPLSSREHVQVLLLDKKPACVAF
jgi:hypothetical protein